MKTDWDAIFQQHWDMYDPSFSGNRVRLLGTTTEAIHKLERALGFEFPAEFHDCYLAANGFGIDRLLLVPVEQIPGFISASRRWLSVGHKHIADRFFPFIDNEYGPTGYFLEEDGALSDCMFVAVRERYHDDPRFDPDAFMEPSAQSIWAYLTC
ncbi:MAG: SMI1/KNR4 family protein [Phycisphaera sp. RhM]|nr:SMI1/KNR4 family protein [Phycisphaera sp. RhM]